MDVTKNTEARGDLTEADTSHSSIPTGGVVALVVLALVLVTFVLLVLCYCLSRRTKKKVIRRGEFTRVNEDLETLREEGIQLPLDIPTFVINKNYIFPPSPSIFSSNTTSGPTFEWLHENKSVSVLALHSVDLNTSSSREEETDQEVRGMVVSLLDLVLLSVVERVRQDDSSRVQQEKQAGQKEELLIEPLSIEDQVSPPDLQHLGPNSPTNISLLSPRSETASPNTTVSTTSAQFLTPRMDMTPSCSTPLTFEMSLLVTPPTSPPSPVSTPPQFLPPPIYTDAPLLSHLVAPSLTRRLSSSLISLPDSNCSPPVIPQSSREEDGGVVRKLVLVSCPLDVNFVIQNEMVE